MAHTDEEMRLFTQIAYADLSDAYIRMQGEHPGRSVFTIAELEKYAKKNFPNAELDSLKCLSIEQKNMWTIAAVHDTNDDNGFYGCIIETSPGESVIAFRGSEDLKDPGNLQHDWYEADLKLLNSIQTKQQAEVEVFLKENKRYLKSCDSISLTGHSLGGNLADYGTLVSHKYGFDDKIDQCISFDGPGFSNEFIEAHYNEINHMRKSMKHYKWSLVGNLLFPLPGVEQKICKLKDEVKPWQVLTRHDTKYLEFDADGNVISGKKDYLSMNMDWISKIIDYHYGDISLSSTLILVYSVFNGLKEDFYTFLKTIADGAKTTYKNFKKALERIFGNDKDYLKVNLDRLCYDARDIRNRFETAKRYVNQMFSSVDQLNIMWKGEAHDSYIRKLSKERVAVNKQLLNAEKYVIKIERDRDAYIKCESKALNIVSSIKI